MIAALAFTLAIQDPPAKLPQPLYDGARDFAQAIERAIEADPKFLEAIEPFASAYWLWRAEQLKSFDGAWIKQELILCGKMIEKWDPAVGQALRQFALQSTLEDPDRDVPPILDSDLRLAYVNRLGRFTRDKSSVESAMFDAGIRLAELSSHLVFAEFVDAADLKSNAGPALRSCSKFGDEKPQAPADLRARVVSIGSLVGTIPFTSETMKEVGNRVARALATQIPEKLRWKIPPDPPTADVGHGPPDLLRERLYRSEGRTARLSALRDSERSL
jgi:hypothetical protein